MEVDADHVVLQGNTIVQNKWGAYLTVLASNVSFVANRVGVTADMQPAGNEVDGMYVQSDLTRIESNIIAANGQHGLQLGEKAADPVVHDNLIGTDGSTSMGNGWDGIKCQAPRASISNTVIAANGRLGIFVLPSATDTVVSACRIGTDATGVVAKTNKETQR